MRSLVSLSVAVIAVLATATVSAAEMRSLRLATGKELGTYNLVGAAIRLVVEQSPVKDRLRIESVPTSGSTINVSGLREGAFDLALIQADQAVQAVRGSALFDGKPFPELRVLARLHEETTTLIVRQNAEIATLADLSGKRISIGPENSGGRAIVEQLLTRAAITPGEVVSERLTPQGALCGKKADAMLLVTGHPSALLAATIARCRAKIVPVTGPAVDALVDGTKGLDRAAIPARVYVGVSHAVPTIGTRALLAARADLDDSVVVDLLKVLADDLDLMRMLHPALTGLDKPADLKPTLSEPLVHPAAAAFLAGLSAGKGSGAK